jgi:hypothetical protein
MPRSSGAGRHAGRPVRVKRLTVTVSCTNDGVTVLRAYWDDREVGSPAPQAVAFFTRQYFRTCNTPDAAVAAFIQSEAAILNMARLARERDSAKGDKR